MSIAGGVEQAAGRAASSTLVTPTADSSGVNSAALARKYSSASAVEIEVVACRGW